jgi:hypothetical protein
MSNRMKIGVSIGAAVAIALAVLFATPNAFSLAFKYPDESLIFAEINVWPGDPPSNMQLTERMQYCENFSVWLLDMISLPTVFPHIPIEDITQIGRIYSGFNGGNSSTGQLMAEMQSVMPQVTMLVAFGDITSANMAIVGTCVNSQ